MRTRHFYISLISLLSFLLFGLFVLQFFPRKSTEILSTTASPNNDKKFHNFWYIHPLKTDSKSTVSELLRYCKAKNLDCNFMSYTADDNCKNTNGSVAAKSKIPKKFIRPWQECVIGDSRFEGKHVDHFYITKSRFELCCKKRENPNFSVFQHVYLADPETLNWMHSIVPDDALKFTIIRNPVQQFVDYFDSMRQKPMNYYYSAYIPELKHPPTLEFLVDDFLGNKTFKKLLPVMSNVQARTLGWDGKLENLDKTIQFLGHLDFVCVKELIGYCWRMLKHKLNAPKKYFDTSRAATATDFDISDELKVKIRQIQYADMRIYEQAITIFERKFRLEAEKMKY